MFGECWLHRLTIATLLLLTSWTALLAGESDAYFARRLWTGQGEAVDNGVLVVVDGKIAAIGPRETTPVPDDARRHELGDRVIIPGLIAAQTTLANLDPQAERALTPQHRAVDAYDFLADRHEPLAGGVTTIQLSPGTNRLMPGMGSVVKLGNTSPETRVLKERESLQIVLTGSSRQPPTVYDPPVGPVSVDRPLLPTQPQLSKSLAGAAAGLRSLLTTVRSDSPSKPMASDPVLDVLQDHLEREGRVRITAEKVAEIQIAVNLAQEFKLPLVLVDPSELKSLSDQLPSWAERVEGVILEGESPTALTDVPTDLPAEVLPRWLAARRLLDAGLRVAIRPAEDQDLQDLLFVAGQFRQGGLSTSEALRLITRAPAEIMGIEDRVGSLAAGLDADFVVLTADPFTLHANVSETYASGQAVYRRKPVAQTTVIRAGEIYTGDGSKVSDASLVIQGTQVRGLGKEVSAPLDAEVRDFGDAVIVPGFVDLGTGLGLGGPLNGSVPVQTKLGERLYPDDPALPVVRRSGVTTVLLGASNSPSPLVAFKLGDDARVIADPVAIRFQLNDNLATAVPSLQNTLKQAQAYHQQWLDYEAALAEYQARQASAESTAKPEEKSADEAGDEAQEQPSDDEPEDKPKGDADKDDADKDEDQKEDKPTDEDSKDQEEGDKEEADKESTAADKAPEAPRKNEGLEPYRALFAGQIPAFVEARRSDAIAATLQLFCKEFQLRTVLVGGDDLVRFPELLEGYEVSVCAGPDFFFPIEGERKNLPQSLATQGVPFGFQSAATTGVASLPRAIQFSVSQGLGSDDALRGLTSNPAAMLSGTASFGTLAIDKDADLVVLSGPPFELSSRIIAVMIDGQWVYEEEHEQ